MISVKLTGVDKLLRSLTEKSQKVTRDSINAVYASALKIQSEARRKAPVDTGRLRSSISIRFLRGGLAAEVVAHVHYAKFQEFGTRFMKARPFLVPAYEKELPRFRERLRKIAGGK